MEVRDGEGAKVQLHVDDIPQGSAMEVLREGIKHGGVQHQLPFPFSRHIWSQDEMDASRFHWTAAEESIGPKHHDNSICK